MNKRGQSAITSEDTPRIISKPGYFILGGIILVLIIGVILVAYFLTPKEKIEQNESGFGNLEGFVYSPNGLNSLYGVKVSVAGDSKLTTFTNESGYFILNLIPSGKKKIIFEQGSFKNEITLNISGGKTVILTGNDSIKLGSGTGASIVKMAVVLGSYDSIELILDDLGFKKLTNIYSSETGYVLFDTPKQIIENSSLLNEFSILFMNCGTSNSFDENYSSDDTNFDYSNYEASSYSNFSNLASFVNSGGSLYVSDLEYPTLEKLYPEFITFSTSFGDEQVINATILDKDLIKYMGKKNMQITFDLGGWAIINSTGLNARVLIEGNILGYENNNSNNPLMVTFESGLGRVLYTSFHNEVQKTEDMDRILKKVVFNL
jgi:hypothetical protein